MKSFSRMFRYIFPQWNRMLLVFLCALVIALLYAFSFASIAPLLTVMMGNEGLHGWVNRNVINHRYGLEIYVPEKRDFVDPNNIHVAYRLRIVEVKEDSPGGQAGLKSDDLITGIKGLTDEAFEMPAYKLMEYLATAEKNIDIPLMIRRPVKEEIQTETVILNSSSKPIYANLAYSILSVVPEDRDIKSKEKGILLVISLLAVATAIRCLARFFQDYISGKIVFSSIAQLREDTFSHALELPVGYFSAEGPSDTVSRFVRDSTTIGDSIFDLFGRAIREPLKAIALLAVAMLVDYKLSLIFLCGAPAAVFVLERFGKRIKKMTRRSLQSWAQMLGKLEETLAGLKVVKVYNQESYEHKNLETINRKLLVHQFGIAKVTAATAPLLETLGMFAGCAAVIFGAHWVFSRTMRPESFFMMLACLGGVGEAVRRVSPMWNKIQQANAACDRVFQIVDETPETEEPNAFEIQPLKNQIEFRNIVFTYPGAKKPVLKNVSLNIQAGHNLAIVGPNGSGKTTLVNLLPRFYDPDSGEITIDEQNIHQATLKSLRGQIGMVTQNIMTFNDTVAANIRYGKSNAADEEVVEAAKRAYAHDFIMELSNGYDTIIGEQSTGLSGGQLQRIAIARAILKDPAILIFDEATSQVDADSEAKIHKAIEQVMKERTTILIAHRFSTVIAADIIVVMADGQIIATGSHQELNKSCSLYQSLYETQLIKA